MPYVQTRGVTLFVSEVGSPQAPPILFSNSLGTTHRMWDAVVADLAVDHRCILYDQRGHGTSTLAGGPFSIEDLAEDAVAILNALGLDSVHVAGLSLGGMTGQALAIRHPGRVRSLTLMATSACMPPQSAWRDRADLVRREGTAAILTPTLQRWFTPAFLHAGTAALHGATEAFLALGSEGYAACCEAIGAMDLRPHLATITAPTAILAGRDDPATPVAMMQTIADAIPGARLDVIANAAHLLAVEQPEATIRLLRAALARA